MPDESKDIFYESEIIARIGLVDIEKGKNREKIKDFIANVLSAKTNYERFIERTDSILDVLEELGKQWREESLLDVSDSVKKNFILNFSKTGYHFPKAKFEKEKILKRIKKIKR